MPDYSEGAAPGYSIRKYFHPTSVWFYYVIFMYFKGSACHLGLGSKNIIIILLS
jgi:hypothetical protein